MGLDWHDFFTALALMLVFEGLAPFLHPSGWRRAMITIIQTSDERLRAFGLGVIITGLILLQLVR